MNGAEVAAIGSLGMSLSLRQGLEEQKKVLETRLENLKEAIAFLDKNPAFEEFHNLVRKTGF